MPYPHNLHTAREVEAIVRENGAVPATIAILDGVPCIGMFFHPMFHCYTYLNINNTRIKCFFTQKKFTIAFHVYNYHDLPDLAKTLHDILEKKIELFM